MKLSRELLKKISDKVIELVVTKGIRGEEAVKIVWRLYKVPDALYESTKAATVAEVAKKLGMIGGETLTATKAWERLVNENGIVRKQVADASARARRNLVQDIKQVLKDGEATRKAATRLQETSLEDTGKLRKEIKAIAETGASKKQIDSLRRKLNMGLKGKELKSSYNAVLDSVEEGIEENISKQLDYAVMDKTRYNMERVVRTERARATAETDREVIAESGAKFVKFTLTLGHKPDICDAYAKADMGYGAGVYPIDKAPVLPIHPNGKSRLVPVFVPKKTGKEVDPAEAVQGKADSLGVKAYDGINLTPIKKRL